MAIAPTDIDGTQADVETILAAFIRLAHNDAERVVEFLRRWLKPLRIGPASACFPMEFPFELAAILRIAAWQRAGLAADLSDAFPPARELLEDLIRRFIADPLSFNAPAVPRLCAQVVSIWIAHCAWDSPSETGADVWLSEIDNDLLHDAMADFLYEIRNLLAGDT
jgi:hypothetical protein